METTCVTDNTVGEDIDLDAMVVNAMAQREQLLTKFPKLKALQAEIDTRISSQESLAGRFTGMVSASASFRSC